MGVLEGQNANFTWKFGDFEAENALQLPLRVLEWALKTLGDKI